MGENIQMKRENIISLILIAVIIGFVLPKPISTIVSLIILVPTVIYIIIDIVKNGNKWENTLGK